MSFYVRQKPIPKRATQKMPKEEQQSKPGTLKQAKQLVLGVGQNTIKVGTNPCEPLVSDSER